MFYCISITVKRDGKKNKTKRDLIQEVVDSRQILKISPQTHLIHYSITTEIFCLVANISAP